MPVWGGHVVVTDGALTQCLIYVRRAIGDESQQIIKTVPRRGYLFDVPVAVSDGAFQRTIAQLSLRQYVGKCLRRAPAAPAPLGQPRLRSLRRGSLWWRCLLRWCRLRSGGVSIAAVRMRSRRSSAVLRRRSRTTPSPCCRSST